MEAGPSENGRVDEASYQRRREQVRRAQKVHRNRRAAYVSALEREVEELRAEKAALKKGDQDDHSKLKALEREVLQLRAEKADRIADAAIIEKLKALLELHGIDLPVECRFGNTRQYNAVAELHGDTPSTQYLQVTLPNSDFDSSEGQMSRVTTSSAPNEQSQCSTQQRTHQPYYTDTQHCGSNEQICRDGTNGTQAGVDFVLALEHICLHHHKAPSPELFRHGQVATGHGQLLQTPIMARVPTAATDPRDVPLQSGCQWTVPVFELENLLSLSHWLHLDGEITPIQIWQKLRSHSRFSELTNERLDRLRDGLLPHVICYDFGAVVAETLFTNLFLETFEGQAE